MNSLALAILAAGESKRFGKTKQLAKIGGRPMLQIVTDEARKISRADLYIALGANRDHIVRKLDLRESEVIFNPEWSRGIASTIQALVKQLQERYKGILFWAGDQPLLGAAQLELMVDRWYQNPDLVCCAEYQGTRGIPAIFPRRLYPQLLGLQGDQGAKPLLIEQSDHIECFALAEAAVDIDTPADLKILTNS